MQAESGLETPGPSQVLNDRYEILRLVGQGGMGAVYLVFDRQLGKEMALKSFPPASRRVEDLAHFEHEFLTLSRLSHPNIAQVYDFGVIEGTQNVFFTSEYIDGKDLLEVTEGLSEAELAPLLVQICRGLEYIHSREIIHYDVKPSNVVVTNGPDGLLLKVIDFGLAAQRVDDALGIIKGTVSYLAPEVARHTPVDHRADLYSLGVTMFHCVTRCLPFRGETNLDVVRRVVSDETPDPHEYDKNLSDGLRDVIVRLMSKDPGARYQSGNDVIHALGELYDQDYATEPREATLNFVVSGGFIGREAEYTTLTQAFDAVFSWREADDPLSGLPPALNDSEEAAQGLPDASGGFVQTTSGGFILELNSGEFELDSSSSGPQPASLSARLRAFDLEESADLEGAVVEEEPEAEAKCLSHVYLVSGETGVGKSRLLKEFKTYSQLRRISVVEGHAGQSRGVYAAFVDVFRGVLGLWSESTDQAMPLRPRHSDPLRRRLLHRYGTEMVRLIPELDSSSLPVAHRAQLSPEQEELRLLDALAQFLIGYSRSRPLVVILHDLEEADQETLELLRYLCRNLALIESARALSKGTETAMRPLRLLVVGSYRPSEVEGKPAGDFLDTIRKERVVAGLDLGPLDADQTYRLVESMLGIGSEPRDLAKLIYKETKGNPFFTVELMRSLVESDTLLRKDGRWQIDLEDLSKVQVPETISDVLLERVRRTKPEERGPLMMLAVLGRGATIHELAALLGETTREIIAKLADLEKRQVLHSGHRVDTRYYDFVHDLARDAIYNSIDPAERISLHEVCGAYLEKRVQLGHGTVVPGELVRHFSAAGDRSRALEYGIRAGDEARAVYANQKAISFYAGTLALLPIGSSRWRGLLQRIGDLLALSGQYGKAAEAYGRLLSPELEERLAPFERVRAYRRHGEILANRGDFDSALESLSKGSTTAYGADGLEREAAAIFAATASVYYQTGRYQDAIGFCEVGLSGLLGLTEGEEAAQARTVLGRSRLALGDLAEAEGEFERCLAIRRRQGNDAGIAQALGDLGLVALQHGRLEEATSRFERALERETAMGHTAGVAIAARRLAQACQKLCEYDRGVSLLRRALVIHEKTGNLAEAVQTHTQLGLTYTAIGEYDLAFEHLRKAGQQSQVLDLLAEGARTLNAEAQLFVRLGDTDRAEELANEALRKASLHGEVPRERAAALETLGQVQVQRGELDLGEQLLHEAQALFRKQEDPAGVLRTTMNVIEIFLLRGNKELTEAALNALEDETASSRPRAQLLLRRGEAALAFETELTGKDLGHLERAMALAEKARDRELCWRIAATRARVLERLGNPEGALESLVESMSGIRALLERIPARLRTSYLRLPASVACKDDFARLRSQLAREEPS